MARPRTRPEFHQLAIFLNVVETGSFAASARRMGCSQPAISQAIARLEDSYGGDLFERRRGAALALTTIGHAILPSARILIQTIDEQMHCAVEAARGHIGTVTLGFHAGLAGGRLRDGVADFIAAHPDVRVEMVEAAPEELHQSLIDQRIDLVVTVASPCSLATSVAHARLWEEPVFAAVPTDHPLAERTELDWAAVASAPLILSASSGELVAVRALSERFLGQPPEVRKCAVSRDALLEMVGIGVGCSIILGTPLSPHRDVAFRPISGTGVGIEAIWREQDGNPVRHRLLNHIRERHSQSDG